MNEEIIKCGWLTKKGAFQVGGWKKRWFVLQARGDGGHAVLAYYRKQTDAAPAGEIALDESTLAYHNVDADKPCVFCIKTKGRTYEILAAEKTDMMSWIELLMQSALGLTAKQKLPATASGSETTETDIDEHKDRWVKFHVLGMQCECCWETLPEQLKAISSSVVTVRLDAGANTVAVLLSPGDPTALVSSLVTHMQDDFGFLVTVK